MSIRLDRFFDFLKPKIERTKKPSAAFVDAVWLVRGKNWVTFRSHSRAEGRAFLEKHFAQFDEFRDPEMRSFLEIGLPSLPRKTAIGRLEKLISEPADALTFAAFEALQSIDYWENESRETERLFEREWTLAKTATDEKGQKWALEKTIGCHGRRGFGDRFLARAAAIGFLKNATDLLDLSDGSGLFSKMRASRDNHFWAIFWKNWPKNDQKTSESAVWGLFWPIVFEAMPDAFGIEKADLTDDFLNPQPVDFEFENEEAMELFFAPRMARLAAHRQKLNKPLGEKMAIWEGLAERFLQAF